MSRPPHHGTYDFYVWNKFKAKFEVVTPVSGDFLSGFEVPFLFVEPGVRSSFRSVDIPSEKIIDTFVLILTENAELNAAIISTGLQSFVEIAKKLGWIYGYVGGTMKSKLVGGIDLTRSVPIRGTMQKPGSHSPIAHPHPHAHPLTT